MKTTMESLHATGAALLLEDGNIAWPEGRAGTYAERMPLRWKRRQIGELVCDRDAPFSDDDRALLEAIAHHAAVALEHGRAGSAVGSEAERVKGQSFVGSRGVNATVARTRQPLMVDDYQASPYALPEFPDLVATITTPVLFGERLLGVLASHTTQAGKRFSPSDLRMLEMLATQAAIAIENAQLYREARERGARFRALSELSRKMTASLDLQQVFDYAVRAAVDLLDLALARLWVWQEATGLLHVLASAGS